VSGRSGRHRSTAFEPSNPGTLEPALPSPLVSIVIPARDAADWIEETLASVVAQTYPSDSLEVIVVDDGSVDGTAEVAARQLRASGLRHRLLRREVNGGPAVARNDGWRRAEGEWVQFLDADDLLAPDKIAIQARAAADVPPDVAAVVSAWSSLVEERGGWVPTGAIVDPRMGEDPLVSVLHADNFIATGSQLFRRTWLETVDGYDTRHRLVEDVHLLIRLITSGGRLLRVPSGKPLFWYRRRPASLSSTDERAFVGARIRNARLVEDHWRRTDRLTPGRREFLADLYASAVRRLTVDDPAGFDRMADHIETLQPAFVPSEPRRLRQLARVVGYRRAERTAGRYRRLKALARRAP
jgi:glycosyltransferase involved in cell wall biosynthesis